MTDTQTLLQNQARGAARELAQRWLQRAAEAAQRLHDEADSEALHDFRVGLRRLRATERAYRPQLEDVFGKKLRRRLRRLARDTNLARDAEVQLQWLDAQRAALRPHQRRGWHYLRARLLARIADEYGRIRAEADREFHDIAQRLDEGLSAPPDSAASPPFAAVCAAVLRATVGELTADVAALDTVHDDAAIHELRLTIKRARYLLDPVADAIAAPALPRALSQWQDRLGSIHDLQVLGDELVAAGHAAGMRHYGSLVEQALRDADADLPVRRGDERAGLVALARLAAAEQRRRRDELQAAVRGGEADRLIEQVAAAASALHPVGGSPDDVEGSPPPPLPA
jgi:CHAD domain-containing protein